MAYYHLPTDTERAPDRRGEEKLSDGTTLTPPGGRWTPDLAAHCGFVEVVETERPADTETTTHDRTIELVAGTPTVVWTPRAKTADELAAQQQAADDEATRFVLTQAIPTLRQWADDAEAVNVTQGNAVATLGTVVDRLAVFFDRFADLLEHQYGSGD